MSINDKENLNKQFKAVLKVKRSIDENGNYFLEGVASSDSIDSYRTIFSKKCQQSWLRDIKAGLPTYMELNHDGMEDYTKRIGRVVEAKTIPHPTKPNIDTFYIKAKLNRNNASCKEAIRIMEKPEVEFGEPTELGLSINGYITDYHIEIIDGEEIEVYDEMRLLFIGLVEFAGNPDSMGVSLSKSLDRNERKIKVERAKMSKKDLSNINEGVKKDDKKNTENKEVQRTIDSQSINEKLIPELTDAFNELITALSKTGNADYDPDDMETAIRTFINKYTDKMWSNGWSYIYENRNLNKEDVNNMIKRHIEAKNKKSEIISEKVKLADSITEEISSINDEESLDKSLLNLLSRFNKKEIYSELKNRNKKLKEDFVKMSQKLDEQENVSSETVKENESTETKEVERKEENNEILQLVRSMGDSMKSINEKLESVQKENDKLKQTIRTIGEQPSTKPVDTSVPTPQEQVDLDWDTLAYAVREGERKGEDMSSLKQAMRLVQLNSIVGQV